MPRLSPFQSYSVLRQLDMKGRVQCKLAIFWPILLPQLKKELENEPTGLALARSPNLIYGFPF